MGRNFGAEDARRRREHPARQTGEQDKSLQASGLSPAWTLAHEQAGAYEATTGQGATNTPEVSDIDRESGLLALGALRYKLLGDPFDTSSTE